MNLLKLAPGGHVGRFCIWTASAFGKLDQVYSSENKKGFSMPRPIMANADLQRILQADEVKECYFEIYGYKIVPTVNSKDGTVTTLFPSDHSNNKKRLP